MSPERQDGVPATRAEIQAEEPLEVSDPPHAFFFALAIPAFFVLVFMLHRVFGGGWIDDR